MQFKDIPGLEEQKKILRLSVEKNHVAHAQLFHGPEGSGALALALAFTTFLNCTNRTEDDSCGQCASCSKMKKLAHPDIFFLFPTAGGKKVLSETFIQQWRSFIQEQPYGGISEWLFKIGIKQGNFPVEEARKLVQNLSLKSYEGGYKVVLIWRPEFFNNATANALLKVIEEPPKDTFFLLICEKSEELLTTILSRTQRFAVPAFQKEEVVKYLADKHNLSTTRAEEIALLVQGNLNRAAQVLDVDGDNEHLWVAEWIRKVFAFDVDKLLGIAAEFDSFPKERQKSLLEYSLQLFREIFLFVSGNENLVRLEKEPKEFVVNFSKVFNFQGLPAIMEILNEAHYHIDRNARAQIVFLDISFQIARLIK